MSIPSLTLYLSLAVESLTLPWQPSRGSSSPSFLPYGICGIFRQSGLPKAVSGWISGICSTPLPWESAAVSTSLPLPWYRLCSTIPHLLWRHVRVRKGNPLSLLRFSLLLLPCLPDCTYKLHIPALLKYAGTIILPQPFFQGNLFYYVRGLDDNALFFSIWVKQEEIYGSSFYI